MARIPRTSMKTFKPPPILMEDDDIFETEAGTCQGCGKYQDECTCAAIVDPAEFWKRMSIPPRKSGPSTITIEIPAIDFSGDDDRDSKIDTLVAELDYVQTAYDELKERYELLLKMHDELKIKSAITEKEVNQFRKAKATAKAAAILKQFEESTIMGTR